MVLTVVIKNRRLVTTYQRQITKEEKDPLARPYRLLLNRQKKMLVLPEYQYAQFCGRLRPGHRCSALLKDFSWCPREADYLHRTTHDRFIHLPVCRLHLMQILKETDHQTYPRGYFFESDQYRYQKEGKKAEKQLRSWIRPLAKK